MDGKTFLPIDKCQRLMYNGSSLADDLKDLEKICRKFKYNYDELAERKIRYGKLGNQINWSKLSKVQKCDDCMSPW